MLSLGTEKPENPKIGEMYLDKITFIVHQWNGEEWITKYDISEFDNEDNEDSEANYSEDYDDIGKGNVALQHVWQGYVVIGIIIGLFVGVVISQMFIK
jgi:hypothetical protein